MSYIMLFQHIQLSSTQSHKISVGMNFENLGYFLSVGGFFALHIHSLICLSYQEEINSPKCSGFTDGVRICSPESPGSS